MFPTPLRIPRRWKVLLWKLADRLRKPSAEPLPAPADNPLDVPAFLRRGERPQAHTAAEPGEPRC
jgi:hypothetical protein